MHQQRQYLLPASLLSSSHFQCSNTEGWCLLRNSLAQYVTCGHAHCSDMGTSEIGSLVAQTQRSNFFSKKVGGGGRSEIGEIFTQEQDFVICKSMK